MECLHTDHAGLPSDRDALQALLDFHVEAGVDLALDETPHDRFAERSAACARPGRRAPARAGRPAAPPPRAAEDGRRRARGRGRAWPGSRPARRSPWRSSRRSSRRFDGCALKFSAKNLAFADGNPQGRVMLVGEAPGADEDRIGKPFMGRSGQLLDRMLAADRPRPLPGLYRQHRALASARATAPRRRRRSPSASRSSRGRSSWRVPEFLICLGGPAAQNLLGIKDGILRTRGRWFTYKTEDGREIRTLPTLHPAYLLRQPLQKRLGWRDFAALRRALDGQE